MDYGKASLQVVRGTQTSAIRMSLKGLNSELKKNLLLLGPGV